MFAVIYQFKTKELAEYFVEVFKDENREDLLDKFSFDGFVRITGIYAPRGSYPEPKLIDGRLEGNYLFHTIAVGEIVSNKFEASQAAHTVIKNSEGIKKFNKDS